MKHRTLALTAALTAVASEPSFDPKWVDSIKATFPPALDSTTTAKCYVSSTEPCDVSSMPKDQTTLVYPGGATRCIYSDSGTSWPTRAPTHTHPASPHHHPTHFEPSHRHHHTA